VQKVDVKNRELSLKDPDGNVFKVQVPESVKRLGEIKKGDQIQLDYYQSIALRLQAPGETAPPSEKQFTERAYGELPAGTVGRQVTSSVTVINTDPANNRITIRLADGDVQTLNVNDPRNQAQLPKLKAGDRIEVTYTEALAATVKRKP